MNTRSLKNEEHMASFAPGYGLLCEQKWLQEKFWLPSYELLSQRPKRQPNIQDISIALDGPPQLDGETHQWRHTLCRTWRNQPWTDPETLSLLLSFILLEGVCMFWEKASIGVCRTVCIQYRPAKQELPTNTEVERLIHGQLFSPLDLRPIPQERTLKSCLEKS